MNQISVVIIDDEPIAVEVIRELVSHFTTDLRVDGTATNGIAAVQQISTVRPHLVFMDVDMPLMNGIEVLAKFPNRNFELIFTTGFESQALNKVKHEAIAYLLKPIDPDEFVAAVNNAREQIATRHNP